jgi:hypothetical protein
MGPRSHGALPAQATAGRRNIREQRIAVRMSVFISNLRFGIDVRNYQAANPGSPFGEPNSPQTSIPSRIVGKLRTLVQDKIAHFKKKLSRLFELAPVFVRLNHIASVVENANHRIM